MSLFYSMKDVKFIQKWLHLERKGPFIKKCIYIFKCTESNLKMSITSHPCCSLFTQNSRDMKFLIYRATEKTYRHTFVWLDPAVWRIRIHPDPFFRSKSALFNLIEFRSDKTGLIHYSTTRF